MISPSPPEVGGSEGSCLKEEANVAILLHTNGRQLVKVAAQDELYPAEWLGRWVVGRWEGAGAADEASDGVELIKERAVEPERRQEKGREGEGRGEKVREGEGVCEGIATHMETSSITSARQASHLLLTGGRERIFDARSCGESRPKPIPAHE